MILLTGFQQADPIASLLIAVMILPRAFTLARDALRVLFEVAPDGLDLAEADIDLQSAVLAATDLGLAGAQRAGAVEQLLGEVGQPFQPGRAVVADGHFRGDHVQCFILYRLGPASRRATFFEIR